MKPQDKIDHNDFQELHKHKGSENYEVVKLFDKKMEVKDKLLVDKKTNNLFVKAFQEDKLHEQKTFKTNRVSALGNKLEVLEDSYDILNDGTMWYTNNYLNWILYGDTTELKYLDPFSNKEIDNPYKFKTEEKDPEKWLAKFKELYDKSLYIYTDLSFYYFKIDSEWFLMDNILEGIPEDLEEQYPAKEDQDIRMVALKDMSPTYFVPPNERETNLIKEIDYESTFYEEKKGLDSFKYSAGWWYLEVYMPLGDTLRIKRYASFKNPALELYKIPNAYGGRQDVLFIVQTPKNAHIEQVAGMYAIRPRDAEQPQRRYNLIVYKRDKEGYKIIDKEKSVETEEYKDWVKKKRR